MTELTMTHATESDWPEIIALDARAFALPAPLPAEEITEFRAKVADDATFVIRDTGARPTSTTIVAFSLFYDLPITVPGGAIITTAALSWVSVSATHRRRGLLRRMINAQFQTWRARGRSLAILTASEGTIYERFGFGPAAFEHRVHIDPAAATFRSAPPSDSRVRYGTAAEIAAHIPQVHARWAAAHPGAITRPEPWWPSILADRSFRRNSQTSGLHYLMHADGYVAYRIDARDRTAIVEEFIAVTTQAHHDLWRVVTSLDLTSSIHASIPTDDALPHLLVDARAVAVQSRPDTLWVSILDVVDALAERGYAADGQLVLNVADSYSDRAGRYELTVTDGRPRVRRIDAQSASNAPEVSLDISVLSSVYLGGISVRELAAAGRVNADGPAAIELLAQLFDVPRAPYAGTFF